MLQMCWASSLARDVDAVFYIQIGKVRLAIVSNDGKEATIGILGDGDFFGEGRDQHNYAPGRFTGAATGLFFLAPQRSCGRCTLRRTNDNQIESFAVVPRSCKSNRVVGGCSRGD
jgi:CRP-like cAMP-binding protein